MNPFVLKGPHHCGYSAIATVRFTLYGSDSQGKIKIWNLSIEKLQNLGKAWALMGTGTAHWGHTYFTRTVRCVFVCFTTPTRAALRGIYNSSTLGLQCGLPASSSTGAHGWTREA